MTSCFSTKKGKVLVVDPSGPVRQMMADVVRTTLGFETVEGRPSIQDALEHLETDSADWLLLPLMADQTVNGMHLLRICSETPELKHVRVSLCLEESELYVLPTAYELGMLSHHSKPFTKDTLKDELTRLSEALARHKFEEPLAAATFLRPILQAAKEHASLLAFERTLLDLYPGNAEVMLNLAEPLFHTGRKTESKRLLTQVRMIDAALADRVDAVAKGIFGEGTKITGTAADLGEGDVNILGTENCVVIDSDDTSAKAVEAALHSLGVKQVQCFSNGEAAWEALEKGPEPGLIITEWRLPKITGPMLIQRVRAQGYAKVPIIVLSSLLKTEDMPLVREMGVATVINKPLNKELFLPQILWVMQQERHPSEHQSIERRYRSLLSAGDKNGASTLRAQMLSDEAVPFAKKRLVEAEWAFANANYEAARDAAVESLKMIGDGIIVLNLLGKIFMYLRSHEAALKCFKKAQELSPNNVERLCAIAETETELGHKAEATQAMDSAKGLDPDSKTVTEAAVKVAIAGGDTAAAQKLMSQIESLSSLVGYMNNKAVAHAKCGLTDDAIGLYKKTVLSIPEDRQDTKTTVRYNMALAMVRAGELEAAVGELEEVVKEKSHKVAKKAASLRDRLKNALAKGLEFKLQGEQGEVKTADASGADLHRNFVAQVEAKRGELCCFLVFTPTGQRDVRADSLLAKPPRFQRREAIEREEAMQTDKAKESA
jgi:CheY-like chemotaxis protein